MSSRNDAWSVPGPIQHQVLYALHQIGPTTPDRVAEYIGIRESSVRAALSGMRTMFNRHWIDFCRSTIDGYIITNAGQRALTRAGSCVTAADALEAEVQRREYAKARKAERHERQRAQGLAWRAQVDAERASQREAAAYDRYVYLKKWWDLDQLFENLTEEFLSLQQRFNPEMCNQPAKYRRGARILIEVEVPYDQPEGVPIAVNVPNRSSNPTQVTVPDKFIRQIVSQPLRPGDPVRVYPAGNDLYITGTLVGRIEGTDQLLVNAYHKAVDDKLPQLFAASDVRYDDGAA